MDGGTKMKKFPKKKYLFPGYRGTQYQFLDYEIDKKYITKTAPNTVTLRYEDIVRDYCRMNLI